MKVVFIKDVPGVAAVGEVKEVASGYGRNFLIPQKLALAANPQAIELAEAQRRIKARQQAENEAELRELASQLEGKEISLKARVGANEQLYGSVTNADIAAELKESAGITVDKKKIELAEPIRQLGSYEVTVKLAAEIVPKIKVTVTEEAAKATKSEKTEATEKAEEEPE